MNIEYSYSYFDKNVDFPLLNGAGDTLERGDGEEREEDGDKCGNKFCPGENNDDGDTFSLKKNISNSFLDIKCTIVSITLSVTMNTCNCHCFFLWISS